MGEVAKCGDANGVLGRDVVVKAGRCVSLDRRRLLLSLICSTDVRRDFTSKRVFSIVGKREVLCS